MENWFKDLWIELNMLVEVKFLLTPVALNKVGYHISHNEGILEVTSVYVFGIRVFRMNHR